MQSSSVSPLRIYIAARAIFPRFFASTQVLTESMSLSFYSLLSSTTRLLCWNLSTKTGMQLNPANKIDASLASWHNAVKQSSQHVEPSPCGFFASLRPPVRYVDRQDSSTFMHCDRLLLEARIPFLMMYHLRLLTILCFRYIN